MLKKLNEDNNPELAVNVIRWENVLRTDSYFLNPIFCCLYIMLKDLNHKELIALLCFAH